MKNATICLLFSSSADRKLIREFLRRKGYKVCAPSFSKISSEECKGVDLIVADEEVALRHKNILFSLKRSDVLVPLLVALPEKADASLWLSSGFDDVLRLPITKDELVVRLGVFLRLREQSKEQYRSLVENSLIGFYRIAPDGHILMANPALMRMLGFSSLRELAEWSLKPNGFSQKHFRSIIKEKIDNEGKVTGMESAWEKHDGAIVYVRESARAVRDVKGDIIYYEGTVEDITDRKCAEDLIRTSLKEKEVLLQEIHHRVKNNMQIISSLLRLQARTIKDKKIREILRASHSRIRSMALIHESLYRSEDYARIDFSAYIKKLTTHLLSAYAVEANGIHLEVKIEDVYLDINKAIPCGLLVNELVSNSLKHGFQGIKKGNIQVKMRIDKAGEYTLVVRDTGIGLPKNMDIHKTETLGMQLITDLVRQLEGSIKLRREKGTEFRIKF